VPANERAGARWQLSDAAGSFGAIVAALCCAGTPLMVAALAATGLTALRRDAILWPVMLLSLCVALWGFQQGQRMHRVWAPLIVGSVGAIALALGVIVVHGPPAMVMIYGGAVGLVIATFWNVVARRKCTVGMASGQ
jgi:mercuric ion transport protein